MALQAELEKVDSTYRARAVRLQAGAALAISRLFQRLEPEDIIRGSDSLYAWLDQSVEISFAVRERAREEAVTYFNDVRQIAVPRSGRFSPPVAPTVDIEALRTSLFTQGVVGMRNRVEAIPKVDETIAKRLRGDPDTPDEHRNRQLEIMRLGETGRILEALAMSADAAGAAAGRHVADGGREQIIEAAKADRRAVGYVRVTSGKPCFFCSALASRGPVYDDDSFKESDARFTGPGEVKVHDSCSCALRAVFSREKDQIPMLNIQFDAEWEDLSRELGRAPTLLDWRRRYEGRATAA